MESGLNTSEKPMTCEICGKEIDYRVRWHRAKTCSLPCSQELERRRMRRWYDNNLEVKKEYDKGRQR